MTTSADLSYEQFVVIAETEWKFDYGNYETELRACTTCGSINRYCPNKHPVQVTLNPRITKQSLKMGLAEWNIVFSDQAKILEFRCQTVAEGTVDKVHMELVGHERIEDHRESYKKMTFQRHVFTPSANLMQCELDYRDNVFTIRVLKDRSILPDFTLEGTVVERIRNNGKLRVGDQVFHVNKQFLAMHSEYFDLLYNGNFKEANQDEIELRHERADPTIFHDFLLVMHVAEALPNPKNVAALSYLANIYQVDNVQEKCHRHLWMCREMPVEERYMLAGELGFNGLQTSIKNNASFEEGKRIIDAVSKKAFALTK